MPLSASGDGAIASSLPLLNSSRHLLSRAGGYRNPAGEVVASAATFSGRKMKLRAALVLLALALASPFATASVSLADDATSIRSTVACTPQVWNAGCATPLNLAGLVHLLNSPAATLDPLQFLALHFVVSADDCAASLGSWAKADGLDGAGEVTLTRAASASSALMQAWLNGLVINSRPSQVTIT